MDAPSGPTEATVGEELLPTLSDSALLLSRVLERETRKQSIIKRVRQPARRPADPAIPLVTAKGWGVVRKSTRTLLEMRRKSSSKVLVYPTVSSPISLRGRVWQLFQDPMSSLLGRYVSFVLLSAVFAGSVIFVLQTEPALAYVADQLSTAEHVCIYLFSIEFALRLGCTPSYTNFVLDFFNWIDLISIMPYYIELFLNTKGASSVGFIRIMRLLRVARILKLSRYTSSIQTFMKAMSLSAKPLFMLLFLMAIAMMVFSSAMYFAEYTDSGCRQAQYSKACSPNQLPPPPIPCCDPNPFYSIAATFWWCIVSMTTVGYGDDVPVTPLGKLIASFTMMSGMLILALPISVIGSNFQQVMKEALQLTIKKNMELVTGKDILRRDEIKEILRSYQIIGEDIDINPDELIALYDVNHTGTLEDQELLRFQKDLNDLHTTMQAHHMCLSPHVSERARKFTQSNTIAKLQRIDTPHDPLNDQMDALEELLEMRLLESEVRMEAKLNKIIHLLAGLEKQVEMLQS
ncbi:Voltage-gated Ion Channel (VIC) Superfamily [Achlya hypogyna]|uniref:Voltage-gated Ion Channel (VIC) Superfamily n=1 Tax=Achlya hypogyna TaxID=1202772 RepID=A0A1V9ZH54_ACHHY|nr:Voltage-gated Ion Channel (VIC) Superfamily [Achlya hypogyna]